MSQTIRSTEEFAAVLKSHPKVVVDFFAVWCGPCKSLKPSFEQWASEYTNIKFVTVDVDECEEIAESHNIQAMPTIKLFHNGQVADEVVGAQAQSILSAIKALDAK